MWPPQVDKWSVLDISQYDPHRFDTRDNWLIFEGEPQIYPQDPQKLRVTLRVTRFPLMFAHIHGAVVRKLHTKSSISSFMISLFAIPHFYWIPRFPSCFLFSFLSQWILFVTRTHHQSFDLVRPVTALIVETSASLSAYLHNIFRVERGFDRRK